MLRASLRHRTPLAVFAVAALALTAALNPAGATAAEPGDGIDPSLLAGLAARSIGPAAMSGRVAAIDATPGGGTVYVGAATGGLWKSIDGGLTFEPVFDDQPVAAIGAVALFQPSPEVIWVGTGEGNPRNSASVGNGVYRSLDGGETWAHLGLEGSERIHRILTHPADRDVAYVCAMGAAWGENHERGVFKTGDGGATWQQVLFVDERTGCADLAMDPGNPDKLFAALWDHRRHPWSFRSGGPGSGLYVSHDGGASWRRLGDTEGLPGGPLGRIGVAVAAADPRRVYALIEAEENALYRSDDGGASWSVAGTGRRIGNRPFYYADIRVDPEDPGRVYSLWSLLSASDDGGESFELLTGFRHVHPDHHALWIDPADPHHLLDGNDGGVYESRDRGATWRFVGTLPLAQYYHLRVDLETPYNVYGGLQDNGSWRGPSAVWETSGIRHHHWVEVGFGDGFDTAPIPGDPRRGYAMSQEGYLRRWDLDSGERKDIRPPAPAGEELRFNWNAALALDPFDPDVVYYGSQFVHRSRDRGESWEILSPDLTTDKPEWQRQADSGGLTPDVTGAENYTTLTAIAPSPIAQGVIWAGSDDGRLHVSRDGGANWTSVEGNVPGVPAGTWIPHVAPSPHEPATAFVVFDDHRRSSWTPYVFETRDYGATWKSLSSETLRGYALVVEQDPVDPDLLFLGTEFGLWLSLDRGASWLPFTHGVPTVSVMDLTVHPREHDLVLGTHGRGVFIVDHMAPLRDLDAAVLAEPLHLFGVADGQQYEAERGAGSRFAGHGGYRGENRPYGALITFSLADPELPHPDAEREREHRETERRRRIADATAAGGSAEEGEETAADEDEDADEGEAEGEAEDQGPQAEIVVLDAGGEVVRSFEAPVARGVNRAVWDLRHDAFREPPRPDDLPRWSEPQGPEVLPGTYTVRVSWKEHSAEAPVTVRPDPRQTVPDGDRRARQEALFAAGRLQEAVADAVEGLRDARAGVEATLGRLPEPEERSPEDRELARAGRRLLERLAAVERELWKPPEVKGIPAETDALSKVSYVYDSLGSWRSAPSAAQRVYLEVARDRVAEALDAHRRLVSEELEPFRRMVHERRMELVPAAGTPELPDLP